MGKHRIYEIAKELGKSNQEVIDVLAKNNIQVKSLSTVDDAAKEMVVRSFAKKPVQPEKKPASATPSTSSFASAWRGLDTIEYGRLTTLFPTRPCRETY